MRTGQNIYKRRDGRWEARVPLGKKADGRPHFKYLYASTYREVLLQKNNYENLFHFFYLSDSYCLYITVGL